MLPHFLYAVGRNIYICSVVKYERQFSVIAYLIRVILGICGNQIRIEKIFLLFRFS
jgi:hypothetical protein